MHKAIEIFTEESIVILQDGTTIKGAEEVYDFVITGAEIASKAAFDGAVEIYTKHIGLLKTIHKIDLVTVGVVALGCGIGLKYWYDKTMKKLNSKEET